MTKVLFVCTGSIDRSPTAEDLLGGKSGFEARSAGTMVGARRPLTRDEIMWADKIFVMEEHHRYSLLQISPNASDKVSVLGIPDLYHRGDPELVEIIRKKLSEHGVFL
ncbi:MAG: phosphotyrosine protein phosphatase [Theionarchaea archaeon]|nr:phosphotyrosine protein phosphatase [Theionarchaea archaeon]